MQREITEPAWVFILVMACFWLGALTLIGGSVYALIVGFSLLIA